MKKKRILSIENPELLKDWDYEKNSHICSPDSTTIGSDKKVWWKCSVCGNEWQARISSRTRGNGCPVCGRKKRDEKRRKLRIERRGSLAETHT